MKINDFKKASVVPVLDELITNNEKTLIVRLLKQELEGISENKQEEADIKELSNFIKKIKKFKKEYLNA